MKVYRWVAYVLVVLCFGAAAAQDNTCSAYVQQALSAIEQDCASTGRNQVCYGNVSLEAMPRQGVQNFNFNQTGDLANVTDISTLRLSSLNPASSVWGIALMKLQANLPDTLPGQNVTLLLFGDVQIESAGTTVSGTSNGVVNVRGTPATDGDVIGTLARGQAVTIDGRSADGAWLRIQIPDSGAPGWVLASLVTASSDVGGLAVVDSNEPTTPYTPMQAFYFQTGITQYDCSEAPSDGILIQTPEGVGQINLRANDVDIQLGSTAYVQAQPSGNMTVSVVEGKGRITAQGVSVDVPAGTLTTIPMDANLRASGAPTPAQPYDPALVAALPVGVLPEQITIAPPAAEATETPGSGAATGSVGPYSAQTTMNLGGVTVSGTVCALDQPFEVTFTQTAIITWAIQFVPADATQGTYSYSYSIADAGETATGEGTYVVSDAAADGSRALTFDGTQTNKFNGGSPTMQLHYTFGLTPTAGACGG